MLYLPFRAIRDDRSRSQNNITCAIKQVLGMNSIMQQLLVRFLFFLTLFTMNMIAP